MNSCFRFVFLVAAVIIFGLCAAGCSGGVDHASEEWYNANTNTYRRDHYVKDQNGNKKLIRSEQGEKDEKGLWHGKMAIYIYNGDEEKIIEEECEYFRGRRHGVCKYYRDGKYKLINYENGVVKKTDGQLTSLIQIKQAQNLIYEKIEIIYPWFNVLMSDFDEFLEDFQSFLVDIESYIEAKKPIDLNEFRTAFDDAIKWIKDLENHKNIYDKYKMLLNIELVNASRSVPLRLAVLDRYLNGLQLSTYQILKSDYSEYLSLLNQYGATNADIQRFADEFDYRLDQLGTLDTSDPGFIILADERINSIFGQMHADQFDFGTTQGAFFVYFWKLIQDVDPLYQGAMRAYFSEDALISLSVYLNGEGRVISHDGRIQCPGVCLVSYATDTLVSLTATPDTGWQFTGWSGACSGTGSCTVSMTQNQNVTATFKNDDQDGAADYYRKVNAYFYGTFGRSATAKELEWGAVLHDNKGSVWKPQGAGLQHYLSDAMGWGTAPLDRNTATSMVAEIFRNLFGTVDDINPRLTSYYVNALIEGKIRPRGTVNAILNDLKIMPRVDGTYGQPNGWTGGVTINDLLTNEQFQRYRKRIETW